jgi:protein gp37
VARLYDKAFETHSRRPFPAEFYPTLYARRLDEPLRRKKPAVIFLGSMGDVFDPAIPDEFRDRIFATVAAAHWHTFVVLTKRAGAMRDYFTGYIAEFGVLQRVMSVMHGPMPANLVIGVSVTNQADADERIPLLLDTPAAKRMVSVEPMLGPVDLDGLWGYAGSADSEQLAHWPIHFVAVGGKTPGKPLHEQGCPVPYDGIPGTCQPLRNDDCDLCPDAWDSNRPAEWLRSLRDQCAAAGVPFHYKHGGTNPALDGVVYNAAVPR